MKSAGAIIGFGIKGGAQAGKFIESWAHLIWPMWATRKTLAISRQHNASAVRKNNWHGVTPILFGYRKIEHIDDIIADIDQALEKA